MQLRTFCSIYGGEGLFVIVVLLGFIDGTHSLQFTTQPSNADAVEGSPINLLCEVDESNVQIQWTLDGQPVDVSDGRRTLEDNNLRISEVHKNDDAGEFRCVATKGSDAITSEPATLNIIWISSATKVNLKIPTTVEEISEGSRVTLQCKGDGNPGPEYTWYKDGTLLQQSDNHEQTGSRLKINPFGLEDSGTYSCKGENRAGMRWSTSGNITISLADPKAPSVLVAPEDVLSVAGETVQFNCSFAGDPPPSVVWYYKEEDDSNPEGPITDGDGITILDTGALVLESVKEGDSGTFLCMPRQDGSPAIDNLVLEADLVIAKVDDLLPIGPQVVAEYKEYRINCTFLNNAPGGIPLPEITWYDSSDAKVTDDTSSRIHVEGSFLVFTRVEQNDVADYTCKANNIAGEKQSLLTIELATEPVITIKPKDNTVRELTTNILECQATGNPRPDIEWTRSSAPIEGQRFETAGNGSLVIRNAQVEDGGNYVCTATNIAGFKKAYATFLVDVVLKFKPKPINKNLELDEKGKLTCNAEASDKPIIRWFKRVGDMPTNITDSHIANGNGSLIFNPAKKSDAGTYMCIATSGSEVITATVEIDVLVKPKFVTIPKNTTGYEGYPLYIDCQATGDPTPMITWTAVSPHAFPDHFVSHQNGTLIVQQVVVDDGGRYQCVAGSKAGLNRVEIVLQIKKGGPPSATAFSPQLMTRTIAIAVGCAAAYIILVIGLMWWCRHRRRKQRRIMMEEEKAAAKTNGAIPNGESVPLNAYQDSNPNSATATVAVNPNFQANNKARRASYDKMQFPRHDLQSLAVIGHGAFGEVFLARAVGIKDGEEATTVMVKALQARDEHQQLEFRREIDMLTKLNHANIVKLLGLCREAEPQLMITEYLDWGDLKQYLRATRGENTNGTTSNPPPLTQVQKIDIINQVALGMEHLANNRFIHADLAARNCLLSPAMEVKICLMGTSKDLYRAEYHDYHHCLMPVRWMPVEALFEDELSTKSDVWAYGVFVWEVFTQGEMPYKDLDNETFMKDILEGDANLQLPEDSPKEVKDMCKRCWEFSPKNRCSFSEVVLSMAEVNADSSV